MSKVEGAREPRLHVELVAVGHGDALVLRWEPPTGDPSTIVIDGGPPEAGAKLAAVLKSAGADHIDLLVLTHSDFDHVGGLVSYVERGDQLPVARYWGPCLPAFRRHEWLFPNRVIRGLDTVTKLEGLLKGHASISYPVEGAHWRSADGDMTVRVLSPAARLVERLLVGEDADDLFLRVPTPLGWLLDAPAPAPDEDAFAALRAALSSGELTPEAIPALPPPRALGSANQVREAAKATGADPEFFGNNVLNDTSIVLLVEARIGKVRRRLLFTGDLENFTYLMARHPMGLGCEVVKAPHHGSRSFVDRDEAMDEAWQWLRPKAVLVSANGKHKLPRAEFRETVLRYGATLFCTCRRSREILSGVEPDTSCHDHFKCDSQQSVSLDIGERTFVSKGVACGSGATSGVLPVIQIRQHVVEPSDLLDRFTEREMTRHIDWVCKRLKTIHDARRAVGGKSGLDPVGSQLLARDATADGRYPAATNIELILDRAARDGKAWVKPENHYRGGRRAWILPSPNEWKELESWVDGYVLIQLAVTKRKVGLAAIELLRAADTSFLAERASQKFSFPEVLFEDVIWPRLAQRLIKGRAIRVRELNDEPTTAIAVLAYPTSVLAYPTSDEEGVNRLIEWLPHEPLAQYVKQIYKDEPLEPPPEAIRDLLATFCLNGKPHVPRQLKYAQSWPRKFGQ